jgi:histidyl-tRNA synthetase
MYEGLKGFREFYPEEMSARRAVTDTIEDRVRRYGFREIGTPALERTRLYTDKSGEEIVEELYAFEDKGGRAVALTPELTPTVARMVVAKGGELRKPIKWFSTRPFWRYEQVQQGRFREFYQTNVDVFGSEHPESDAEILAAAADIMTDLGLTGSDFEFRVSHRDILGGLLESMESDVETADAVRAVDKKEKIDAEAYYDLLVEAGLSRSEAESFDAVLGTDDLDDLVEFAGTDRVEAAVGNLRAVLEATESFGVREHCTVSLETARGLDYYTGVVFECFDTAGEVSRSVFGGGRYDDLIEGYGGEPTPAVGVGIGHETLSLLCQRAGVWPEDATETDYYVLTVGDTREMALEIAQELRELGHVVESDLSGRGFGDQLSYADGIGAETVVIVGEQDLAEDAVTIKDMESGEQTQAPLSSFPPAEGRPTYDDFA